MAGTDSTPIGGSLEEQAISALIGVIKQGNSPDIAQAESVMLRRLALEGDVVGSRIPAPRNITEIGGYINLLATLKQPEMGAQMLAGILGVAGPNPPLGWVQSTPLLTWVAIPNDRPDGVSQPSTPLSIYLRGDFVQPLQAALTTLHNQGCMLPLLSLQRSLPISISGANPPDDVLPYLARTISVVPAAALNDPDTDPIALARQGTDPYQIVARMLSPGTVAVTPAAWGALKCDAMSCTNTPAPSAGRSYVPIAPVLATAGFYPTSPLPQPSTVSDAAWARFTNITGLVAGQTLLGDELSLLYSATDIAASTLSSRLYYVWNGSAFVAS